MSANSNFTIMVHILTLLAGFDEPLSSKFIAGSVGSNPVIIRKAIGLLKSAGLVDTIPGSEGGAVLGKAVDKITLGAIYQLTKEETFFGLHPNQPNPMCPVGSNIQGILLNIFDDLDEEVAAHLTSITIADLQKQVRLKSRS